MSKNEIPPAVLAAQSQAPETDAESLELSSRSFTVKTEREYQIGGQMLRAIAIQKRRWVEGDPETGWRGWDALVAAAKATYDLLRDSRNVVLDQLDAAREKYAKEMSKWLMARDQLQAKAEASAAAVILQYEENARRFRAEGKDEEAELMDMQAAVLAMNASDKIIPKLEGVGVVDEFDVEIYDLRAFLKDVLDGALPLEGKVQGRTTQLIEVKESLIKEFRKSMGSNFAVKGVKITERKGFRVRAAE